VKNYGGKKLSGKQTFHKKSINFSSEFSHKKVKQALKKSWQAKKCPWATGWAVLPYSIQQMLYSRQIELHSSRHPLHSS
jgi:hypothetical protein